MLRRLAPVIVGLAAAALLVSYVLYTSRVSRELRQHAENSSRLYGRIFSALSDTTGDASGRDSLGAPLSNSAGGDTTDYVNPLLLTLLSIGEQVAAMDVPMVITDSTGRAIECRNLDFCDSLDVEAASEYASRLDRDLDPVRITGGQILHVGYSRVVRWLSIVPYLQAGALLLVLAAGFVLVRERTRAQRESLWAGMAREAAHQLATPLSSLTGWVELIGSGDADEKARRAVTHMENDLLRLERVAHRFERIGRPPRREDVDVGALAESVATYFRARVPTLSHQVIIRVIAPAEPAVVQGDPVLLEWALEALVKNAIDALAGREGKVEVTVEERPEGATRIRVADNGPGVSRELRSHIFEPGFSTKERGWGIGLALTRRIVEENHGGELELLPSDKGAVFEIRLN